MRKLTILIPFFITLLPSVHAETQLPVFIPQNVRITNSTYERIGDMTYGSGTFTLLETNQHSVILIGEGVREVIPLPYSDARYIAYGNGVFVVIGSQGNVSRSTNLHEWEHLHYDGAQIVPGIKELQGNGFSVNRLLSLKYHPAHRHFFVETSNGQVMISRNGFDWGVWADGVTSPSTPYPQLSDTKAVFKHEGNYLKFERISRNKASWQVYQSRDGSNWTEDGQLKTDFIPQKAFYRNGTWLGKVASTCFLNIGNKWELEPNEGFPNGFPAVFSRGRYHHNQILGLRNDHLSEFSGSVWSALKASTANSLQFLPDLDRFFLIDYSQGTVDATYDGSQVFRVLDMDGFLPESIAENNHRLVVAGKDADDKPVIWVSATQIPFETGINQDHPVAFVFGGDGIDWSSYLDPENPSSAKITSHLGNFYLATGYHVYRSDDGLNWEKVYETETDTASWISAMYTYRGKLWITTSNYFQASHLYVPPPEGIEPQNAVLSWTNDDGVWNETVIDDQIYISKPSVDGPYLLEYLYGFPSSTITFAQTGVSIERRWAPWVGTDGTIVWAYGRYYLFQGDSVAKTHFLGFKDADYYREKETFGQDYQPNIDTGYFGRLSPTNEAIVHYTLGTIETMEKPGTDGVIYILSPRWGVLEMDPGKTPYAYSPIDGNTYYVNFHAPSDISLDNDSIFYSAFYNHTTHEWGKQLTCESYDFDQWLTIINKQLVKVESLSALLISYVSSGGVADAWSRKATLEAEFAILKSFKWPALSHNGSVEAELQNERAAQLDASIQQGATAMEAAIRAFETRYTFEP